MGGKTCRSYGPLVIFIFFISNYAWAENIIFPKDDLHRDLKASILKDIKEITGHNNPIDLLKSHDKIVLWTDSAPVLKDHSKKGAYKETSLPSFTAVDNENADHIRSIVSEQCKCDLENKEIAGILIASPFIAAEMYFRHGWAGKTGNEIDGLAPPIVIIYHELGHLRDYLLNSEYFFDSASNLDHRWKNEAESSAVNQQNDFVIWLGQKKGLYFHGRKSYGKNRLFPVSGPYSVEELTEN